MAGEDSTPSRNRDVSPAGAARPPRSAEPEAEVASIEGGDVLEHAYLLRPFDLQFDQLSPGAFRGTVDSVATPSMMLYQERWSQAVHGRGATPPGYVLLGAHVVWRRSPFAWCGSVIVPRTLAAAGPASEIGLTTAGPSNHVVALVKPELLAQGLGWEAADQLCSARALNVSAQAGLDFGRHIIRVVRRYRERPDALSRPMEARSIESDLMDTLIRCLRSTTAVSRRAEPSRRRLAVEAATEFAASCQGRTTAHELSVAAGVSQRTLEYAFRERLGITPGVFLRRTRLNGAHRELLASDPHTTMIWRVASSWGFHQPGRFSALYRRQFGELPSRTLGRFRPSSLRSLSEFSSIQAG